MAVPEGMRDGYIGGIGSASFIPQNPRTAFGAPTSDASDDDHNRAGSPAFANRSPWYNQTDESKMVCLSTSDLDAKITNINKTEEYNVGYQGLSILPWEDFVLNPRILNDLFYQERTHSITYDPDEVNVFFHGKNVMPPTIGDISENGKSWNMVLDSVNDLRKARQWLTERCSVFGVTLVYKDGRFGKKKRAPCLVMLDPSKGSIADRIYTTITRAMDSVHRQRRFCVEINLNGCVERWCRRVLLTECKVVGARLIITNGEEYSNLNGAEDIVCCVVCLPLWLIQAGIYKLHRKVVYDDYFLDFDADDLFLHGTFQDTSSQRQQIFHSTESGQVFRTRSAGQTNLTTLNELGSFKFVSVKKYKKTDEDLHADEDKTERMKEHTTVSFNELMAQRREKVVKKEQKLLKKATKTTYPKSYDNPVAEEKFDENAEATSTVVKNGSEEGDAMYKCCEISDDESIEKFPTIPEVSSVFFNGDADGSDFTEETDEESEQRLFSPKLKNNTSMSLNNALFDTTDFDNKDSAVQPFKAPCANGVIDDDSETEDEDESLNQKHGSKADLLKEMSIIESSLPAISGENKFAAKDLESLTAKEKSKKEKEVKKKKKKSKNKPAVGRVLKDLMKTTEMTEDTVAKPSVEDKRYNNAMSNLNYKFDPKQTTSSKTNKDGSKEELDKNHIRKTKDNIIRSNVDDKLFHSSASKDEPTFESRTSSYEVQENSHTESDNCDVEQFTADDSSTDGEEVEILYQSRMSRKVRSDKQKSFLNEKPVTNMKMCTPKSGISNPLDVKDLDDVHDFQPATDEEKLEASALNSNRNAKFNSAKLFDTTHSRPLYSFSTPGKSASETMNVQDAEFSDDEIEEIEKVNTSIATDRVKSPSGSENNLSTTPVPFASGSAKKQKRGTKQYNSNRKYLGASVPGPKKKSQKT